MAGTQKREKRGRRPKKPQRKFQNVAILWANGRWRCRALVKRDGKQFTGPLRDADDAGQALAYEDAKDLKNRHCVPRDVNTLYEAIQKDVALARKRGVKDDTIERTYKPTARVLLRFWKPDTALHDIDRVEVTEFVAWASETPTAKNRPRRSPNSLREKDLPMLERLFAQSGLPSPVLREHKPKRHRPKMSYFDADEIVSIVDSIRNDPGLVDKRGHRFPQRERHADILELFATSGIRPLELGRIEIENVDLGRRLITVTKPKIDGEPRYVVITPNLVPIVERLCAYSIEQGEKLLIPGGWQTLNTICQRWGKRLGEPRLNGRALRHTFCTGLAHDPETSLGELMSAMGHSDARSTNRYIEEVTARRGAAAHRWASHFAPKPADESSA